MTEEAVPNAKLDRSQTYVWFDTEFTTLDLENSLLLQVALVLTDSQLNRFLPEEKDLNLFVKIGKNQKVSPWVEENLPDILTKCRSSEAISVDKVDEKLAAYMDEHCDPPAESVSQRPVLAGNSIHHDWYLLRKHLPKFMERLNYRHVDVTSIKLDWINWFRGKEFDKNNLESIRQYFPGASSSIAINPHDAYFDVQASIAELGYYNANLRLRQP